jgi:hypothetical protein
MPQHNLVDYVVLIQFKDGTFAYERWQLVREIEELVKKMDAKFELLGKRIP